MSKFFQKKLARLRNVGKLTNQGGPKKQNSNDSFELSTIQTDAHEPSASFLEVKTLVIETCKSLQTFVDFLDSATVIHELEDQSTVLLLKLQIDDSLDDLETDVIENLNSKCFNKSIVILITSGKCPKTLVYWKSKDIPELITLKHYGEEFTENDKRIYEFVADYLAASLSKGQLGLYREWQQFSNGTEAGAHLLADSRDYNLLLIAAEAGNAEIVKILLNCGACGVADDGVTAQDLAWKNRHSEVLLVLARANFLYPEGIDLTQLSDDFKTFYEKTEELHTAIIEKNAEKVKEILNSGRNLEFYFDLFNKSAARVAVDAKAFDIYEILVVHEIFLACHEYQQGVFDSLEYAEQKLIRELHNKHSKDLPDKHINVLMAHSVISHDVPDAQGKLKHVYKAYKQMSQDPRLNTILKTVAASKNARIIYDFNRDAVNIADPTTSGNTEGVFYSMGRIYIGARQLLDEDTRSQAIGTLAHELCHFAVNLTYLNMARPYKTNDNQTIQEFEEINKKSQKEAGKEEIIDLVHQCYPVDMHHAELIVRPAHLIALYQEQPEKLTEIGQTFPELFDFFDTITKEMEAAIPEIERRDEVEAEKKDQKISNLRKKLVLSAVFSVIGIIVVAAIVAVVFYKPVYTYPTLSVSNKLKVTNAPVIYKNIEVRFSDLFSDNSTAYYDLTSDHISQILDEQALDFSDSHFLYLNDLVHHEWPNLADKLKQKFLTSNFTFQNESLKFEKLATISPEVFDSLSSRQIMDVLDGKELKVGNMIANHTEFYLERKLIFEDIKVGYIFLEFLQNYKNKTIRDLFERYPAYKGFFSGTPDGTLTIIENIPVDKFTLEDIYGVIPSISFDLYTVVIKEIEKHGFVKDYDQFLTDLNSDKLKFIHHDFDKVFKEAKKSKIFILSSEAGAGKTVTFEQLAMRIKKKNPVQWVSYIDMKEHVNLFDKFEDVETLLSNILDLGSKTEFERKVFEVLYKSGNAVLLWNGFDEISPDYNQYIVEILTQVRQKTENVQFISTRPLFSLQLRDKFKTRTFQLIPYSKAQQEEFLRKFFTSKNVEKIKIDKNIAKIRKTIQGLQAGGVTSEAKETTRDFNTPLMLKLVAEIYVDDDKVEAGNFFDVYQKFVEKKVGVWQTSSPFVKNIVNKLFSASSNFNIIAIYHKYSLPIELFEALHLQITFELKKLKVMSRQIPKQLPKTEISRMGILYINDDTKYEFAHKTLGEFFTAQYFIENIYDSDDDVGPDEAYYRLEIFFYIAQNYGYNQVMVTDFMKSFLDMVNRSEGHSRARRGLVMGKNGNLRLGGHSFGNDSSSYRLGSEYGIAAKIDGTLRLGSNILKTMAQSSANLRLVQKIQRNLRLGSKSESNLLPSSNHSSPDDKIINNTRFRRETSSSSFQNDDNIRLDHKIRDIYIQNHGKDDFLVHQNDTKQDETTETASQKNEELSQNYQASSQTVKGITPHSDSAKPFSPEIAKLLKTKFKRFLFDLVNPKYPEILKFMLDFFKKDHEILLELLNVNEDETLYTAAFNPNHFVALANPVQIKEIVRSYLNDEEFRKFLSGRNQKGKVLLGLVYYEQKNKPKIHHEIEISSKMLRNSSLDTQEDIDFYDYSAILTQNLTDPEKKEFFLLAITPPFYSASDTSKIPKHEKLWQQFQNLLSKSEIQSAIADTVHKLIKKYPEFDEFEGPANFLPFLLSKAEELLTNSEIFEMFLKFDILHIATYNHKVFDVLWEFVENHFDEKQQKLILQQDDNPEYYRKYDSFHFYHNIPMKIIHKASLRNIENHFQLVTRIYDQRFTVKEVQEIVASPDEFMLEFVICWRYKSVERFKKYFGDLFTNDETSLKNFLERKMKITKMTVFDYFKDVRGEYYDRLQEFYELVNISI